MDARLLSVLACPSCRGELKSGGVLHDDRLVNGLLCCSACALQFPLTDGIPQLIAPGTVTEGAFQPEMEPQVFGWIEANFARMQAEALSAPAARFVETVCQVEGVVVDVASGPGGGYCVPVMQRASPDRLLVMSDLGAPVMPGWRRVLRKAGWEDRCSNLTFDAHRMPFHEGSVQAITSVAGMDNVRDNSTAYGEVARVLAAGGLLLDVVFFYEHGGPTHRHLADLGQAGASWEDYRALLDRLDFEIEDYEALNSGRGKVNLGDGLPLQEDETWELRTIYARKRASSIDEGNP